MTTPYLSEFLGVALVHALAVVTPGPDFAVAVRQSVHHGRRAGLLSALGFGIGMLVHVVYTLIGISTLLRTSENALKVAQWVGAAYLVWLAIRFLRSAPPAHGVADPLEAPAASALQDQSAWRAFLTGFFTNATNPKATLFFLAVFTTLVSPKTPLEIQALYGLWMCVATMIWFAIVAVLFSHAAVRRRFLAHGYWFERIMGAFLLGFAAKLVFF